MDRNTNTPTRSKKSSWLNASGRWLRQHIALVFTDSDIRRKSCIILAAAFVCVYAIGVVVYTRSRPDVGIRSAFTTVVNRFDESFLFPENQQVKLKPYDRLIQLGNKKIENWPQIQRHLNNLGLNPEEATKHPVSTLEELSTTTENLVSYQNIPIIRAVVERDGERHELWCRIGHSPLSAVLLTAFWSIIKAGLFFVGALLLWRRPEEIYARQFFILCVVSCGAYLGGYHWARIATEPILILVFMICSVLLPPVCLHFYLMFPNRKPILERHPTATLFWVYIFPILFLFCLLGLYGALRLLLTDGVESEHQLELTNLILGAMLKGIFIYLGIAFLLYLLSIITLIYSYRTARGLTERNQVKWILFGALVALMPMVYTLFLAATDKASFGGGGATFWMFIASISVTVAYAISITRYRLMQLDKLLSSGTAHVVGQVVGFLVNNVILFLALLFLVNRVLPETFFSTQALSTIALIIVLFNFKDFIGIRLKRRLDKAFRREKLQLDHTLQRMSDSISQLVDPPTLSRRMLQSLRELTGATRGSVYLRQGEPPVYKLTASFGKKPTLQELPPGCPLLEALTKEGTFGRPFESNSEGQSAALRQLHFLGGEMACALVHEDQIRAFLILGPRQVGEYSKEDCQLLTAFAQVTTLALISGEEGRTIDSLNQELQEKVQKIAEQQRQILILQSQLTRKERRQHRKDENDEKRLSLTPPPSPVSVESETDDEHSTIIVGSSGRMHRLLSLVEKVAGSDSAVLLRGESGTGKELLAATLHQQSPRAEKPFVKVHCAALAPALLESELFGHIKGAFTGAVRDRVGRFELANGGTLFLDEIGDISLEVQTKLLRVIQEMSFERVGSSESIEVDVRIIAATHQNLEKLIQVGKFREDLFYRLNVLPIDVPPLRERSEDIPDLIQHFLKVQGARIGRPQIQIDGEALNLMTTYPWPGNIRQLENVIERAVVISNGVQVTVQDLPSELRELDALTTPEEQAPSEPVTGVLKLDKEEKEHRLKQEREQLVLALASTNGNKAEAARALGLARSTLVSRLKKHGLS